MDKNPADKNGETPLHIAANSNDFKTFKFIFEKVEDKNPSDKKGQTPLHKAATNLTNRYMFKSKIADIFSLVFENVEDKNPADNEGITPFHIIAGSKMTNKARTPQDMDRALPMTFTKSKKI